MIPQDAASAARGAYATGVEWIAKDAIRLGMGYLERAIAMFEELGDRTALTRARHQRLLGFLRGGRDEAVESACDEVMAGYLRLGDIYGQALLLSHLAESVARQGRWERAMVHLNLADALAQAGSQGLLQRYVLYRQARLYLERDNVALAARLLKLAEASAAEEGRPEEVARLRAVAGAALARLGERSEAVVLLEDAQRSHVHAGRFREAVEALTTLAEVYEATGQAEELTRVQELKHFCGQKVIRGRDERRLRSGWEPPVDPPPLEVFPQTGPDGEAPQVPAPR
jgi:hypothetical protein